jgi:hypothetical protein
MRKDIVMKLTNFSEDGIWLKGNLHAHSTNSDGELSPKAVINAYKKHGYHFLSLTDHDIYSTYEEFNRPDFAMIPGFELSAPVSQGRSAHFNFLQLGAESDFAQNERVSVKTPEELKEFFAKHRQNYLIMFNHPYWSLNEWEEIIDFNHITCMEVYNHGCEWLDFCGEAHNFWDTMLRKGKRWWGVADDDNHNGYNQVTGWPLNLMQTDSFGGWIKAKAKECTQEAIMNAVAAGNFYASTGPEIYDFYVEDGVVHVKCSPCERILFSGQNRNFQRILAPNLTEYSVPLKGTETFIRVQCSDKYGRTAYGNPIFLL